jgi:hypothetical protein
MLDHLLASEVRGKQIMYAASAAYFVCELADPDVLARRASPGSARTQMRAANHLR